MSPTREPIRVVGIDPGLAATGIGVVAGKGTAVVQFAFGSISTRSDAPIAARLERIYRRSLGVLEAERPHLVVMEDVFSLEAYPRSAILLGKVTGVILLAACHAGVPVAEVPVREAKHVLTGNGNASKMQLEMAVRHALERQEPIRPYHASDALGLALIGLYRYDRVAPRPPRGCG